MPAHDPQNKDRRFEIHLLVVEKETLERIPDGHVQINMEWKGGNRQWMIEGLLEPESPFLVPKHNRKTYDILPQGHGDAILAFLKWVQCLIEEPPIPETEDSPKDVEEGPLPEQHATEHDIS